MKRYPLVKLAALIILAGALALVWWGWQTADAALLLLGVRLC
ncbi:hypothetical protein [Billgrantia aerodenitrificans]|nr:hypothetical protein [Halomonas aerodenitrificans]